MSRFEPLIVTKLHRPTPPADHVPRRALFAALARGQERPLVLVSAPAGFGKTTLVASWLSAGDRLSAWLSLDEEDSDLAVFAAYLLAAIDAARPGAVAETQALVSGPALPTPRALAGRLANDLAVLGEPIALVLDDYHVIHDPAVHGLLDALLRHAPATVQVVLTTRHDPPLPLASLRAGGKLVELRAQDLRFDEAETEAFLRNVLGDAVTEAVLTQLLGETMGWPAAVRLAALSLRHVDSGPRPEAAPPVGAAYLVDYLLAEILGQQPPGAQAFLLRTSVLERLTGPLCEALLYPAPTALTAGETLRALDALGLFLEPLDAAGEWFRYHPLFRQLLLHELRRRLPAAEVAELYGRAAAWLSGAGFVEEALRAALAGGHEAAAVRIVADHRHPLIGRADWRRLERWLRPFGAAAVTRYADLALASAWLALDRLSRGEVSACVLAAERLVALAPDPTRQAWLAGECATFRAYERYWARDPAGVRRQAQRALAVLPPEAWFLRVEAQQFLVTARRMEGRLDLAHREIDLALAGAREHRREAQSRLLLADAVLAWLSGNLSRTAESMGQVLSWRDELDWAEGRGWAGYLVGAVHLARNELAEAETQLAAVYAERHRLPVAVASQAAFALALSLDAAGRAGEARAIADAVPAYLHDMDSGTRLVAAHALQAELALRQGRLSEAVRQVEHMAALPFSDASFYFLPQLAWARVRLADGRRSALAEAAEQLGVWSGQARASGNIRGLIEVLALQAAVSLALSDRAAARQALAEAVTLAEPGGFLRLFIDLGGRLGGLLVQLGAEGVAPGYVARIQAAIAAASPVVDQARPAVLVEPLTDREVEVLAGLAERLSNREIAQRLVIAPETVKRHTLHIYQKLQVSSRREAVAKAAGLGLLRPA